jgi:hypothetical protein
MGSILIGCVWDAQDTAYLAHGGLLAHYSSAIRHAVTERQRNVWELEHAAVFGVMQDYVGLPSSALKAIIEHELSE